MDRKGQTKILLNKKNIYMHFAVIVVSFLFQNLFGSKFKTNWVFVYIRDLPTTA